MPTRAPRVAVYGDVDVNLIDGSSIWLVSVCGVLDRLDVHGHVLLKAPIERDLLVRDLDELQRFRVWKPDDVGIPGRVRPEALVGALSIIDESDPLDIVIVRGLAAAWEIATSGRFDGRLWPYLTDIPQSAGEMTVERRRQLDDVFAASGRVLCQTESLRSFLVSLFPGQDAKMILLPPIVPDAAFAAGRDEPDPESLRLFYAGKFAPMWAIEEMIDAVETVRSVHPGVTITVAGDKIHDPAEDPTYRERVRQALSSEGVEWLGGISRAGVFEALHHVDLALSVRHRQMNASREISTKLLEYAASGVPTIVNRTLAHEELLGGDYPLFVDDPDQVSDVIAAVVENPGRLDAARDGLPQIARSHSIDAVARRLRQPLDVSTAWGSRELAGRKIVVAGHDFKFATELIEGLRRSGASVRLDTWSSHEEHDEAASAELIDWADTVVCEWCLGNAAWYSTRKKAGQRLVVRFHRTELNSPWPAEVEMSAVDTMVFVSAHIRDQAAGKLGWSADGLTTIPNFVDTVAFDRDKLPGAEYNLGILGFLPRLKRLDRALDILEDLRVHDGRYRLVAKGTLPWELPWVWGDARERAYFEAVFDRIRSSPRLRNAVTFERSGGDVPSWFRKIGFVLSVSDIESFHLAMVEGMASRSVPVVTQRVGATSIVDPRWIVEDAAGAAKWIQALSEDGFRSAGQEARAEVVARYDAAATAVAWMGVLAPEEPSAGAEAG